MDNRHILNQLNYILMIYLDEYILEEKKELIFDILNKIIENQKIITISNK